MKTTTNSRKTVLEDPTRQGGTRRRAFAEIKRRLVAANKEISAVFKTIETALVVNKRTYQWLIDERRQSQINDEIAQIIIRYFQTDSNRAPPWFWANQYIERAYNAGTMQSNERLKVLVSALGINVDDNVLFDGNVILQQPGYRDRLALLFGRQYEDFKGLASGYVAVVRQVLTDTVAAGRSPRDAQRELKRAFNMTRRRAERIARTEINRANNVARTDRAGDVSKQLDIEVLLIHRSSLVPGRTRRNHAERHGKTYTPKAQNEWWATGSNRINCLCGVMETVLNDDGKPLDPAMLTRLKNQREKFL